MLKRDFEEYSKNYVPKRGFSNPISQLIDKYLSKKYAKEVVDYYFDLEIAKYLDPEAAEQEKKTVMTYLPDRTNPRNHATANYMIFYGLLFALLFTGLGALSAHLTTEFLTFAGAIEGPIVLFEAIGNSAAHQGILPGLITGAMVGVYAGYKSGMISRTSLKEPAEHGRRQAQQFVVDTMQSFQSEKNSAEIAKQKDTDIKHSAELEKQRQFDEEARQEIERQHKFNETTAENIESIQADIKTIKTDATAQSREMSFFRDRLNNLESRSSYPAL